MDDRERECDDRLDSEAILVLPMMSTIAIVENRGGCREPLVLMTLVPPPPVDVPDRSRETRKVARTNHGVGMVLPELRLEGHWGVHHGGGLPDDGDPTLIVRRDRADVCNEVGTGGHVIEPSPAALKPTARPSVRRLQDCYGPATPQVSNKHRPQ